jgi:hypothetical protein
VDGAGANASRLRHRSLRVFFESLRILTDASGAYRPNPKANNEVCRRPPSLNAILLLTQKEDFDTLASSFSYL